MASNSVEFSRTVSPVVEPPTLNTTPTSGLQVTSSSFKDDGSIDLSAYTPPSVKIDASISGGINDALPWS